MIEEVSEPAGRSVVNRSLKGDDANVVYQAAPKPIAVSIEDHRLSSRAQDPMHFTHRMFLMRKVVKAVRTQYDFELIRVERESLGVAFDQRHRLPHAPRCALEHSPRKIDPPENALRMALGEAPGKGTGPATDLQDSGSGRKRELVQKHLVGGLEKKSL